MRTKTFDDRELKKRLTKEQYYVTQKAGTERPYRNEYHDLKDEGEYRCVVCDEVLFSSETKYDSGTGWPSFWAPVDDEKIENKVDRKLLVKRIENLCSACGAHLGHVFKDSSTPSNARYCMNSASLRFVPAADEGA